MQEGDLADGPLPDILRLLAAAHATGGVHVRRRDERGESADAVLFLREGRLYAATAPGPRPLLGVRLVAAGAVTREALEEALESQAGELAGWRLGELLVHLGYVDGEIVAEFVVEQILDTVAEVSAWVAGGWRFRRGEKTREADGLSLDIEDVLERVAERRQSWNDLEEYAGGATAVPLRVPVDEALTAQQIPLAQAMLGEVDGVRTLAELATRCGLTTYEAGYVLAQLVEVGAVRLAPRTGRSELDAPARTTPSVARIVTAAPATPPAVSATGLLPADDLRFDADDPLGLADLLDGPAAPAAPEAVTTGADDELAALLTGGGGSQDGDEDELDLATQLAVLARQAEEARWAAEARRSDEVRARRAATTAAPAQTPPVDAPYEPIGLIPLDDEPATPPVAIDDIPLVEAFDADEIAALQLVAPYEPIGLAPIETYGLSVADTEQADAEQAETDQLLEPFDAPTDEPTDGAVHLAGSGAARLPTRSAPTAAEPVVDDLLADLRGAIDLAALDDPEPVGTAWSTTAADGPGQLDGTGRSEAPAQASEPEDEEPAYATPEDTGWAEVTPGPATWNPDDARDFTPDEDEPSTDTAALLRELSFLGLDDIPTPPPAAPPRPPAPRQPPVPAGKGRRKSIFGR